MITKLSELFPELTTEQLNDLAEWLSTRCESTLSGRIQAYLSKHNNATLTELCERLRVDNPVKVLTELQNLIDYGVIERYSSGVLKTKYRIKK